ncbi:MAG: hypothetical protein H6621_09225 [Halobacteriovoraceae bacterium]|nr:hypothetical protein [Halobacteriovoraceae bacterium]MCB9095236.1 hypothetical protein [Halobacteriovoraceae bacterium]
MIRSKVSLIIFTSFLFISNSYAFLHFEPSIGYNRGHYQTSKVQGIGFGLKAGFEFGSLFIVGDAGYHDLQLGSTPTSNLSDLSATIGGNFKGWRFWYSHMLSATLTIENSGNTTKITGSGSKIGIGGEVANKVYLNLEARFIDFDESDGTPVTQFMDAGFLSISWIVW